MTQTLTTPDSAQDRQQWLATRPTFLGSSESPAVLGCGYSGENAHTVWLRKMGLAEPLEDDDKLLCGRLLQGGILAVIRHKTGYDIRPADEFGVYRSKDNPWLGATPDSLVYGDPRGLGVCELKNVDHALLKDWKGDDPPLRVNVQLQHQLLAVGATWGICAAIIGGNKPVWYEVELHARFVGAMVPALRKFWRYVEERTPPPVDATEGCSERLRSMFPRDNGLSIGLPEESLRWFEELKALKAAANWIDDRKRLVENQIKAAMGEASEAILPDGRRFTWKSQTNNYPAREAYSTTFRVLRQHEPKGRRLAADTRESRRSECTARLLAMGGTLYAESEHGSRYFELPGCLRVRVSDHEPNQATADWMDRGDVVGVRIDEEDWQTQLEAITGVPLLESEG